MKILFRLMLTLGVGVPFAALAVADDTAGKKPLPTPITRPVMKQALEDLKGRKPRFELPELTEADKEKLGERGGSYEGRLRYHYAPDSGSGRTGGGGRGSAGGGAGGSREQDPNMTLDYAFKTELFWIVSRTNNCLY
jgi:hypothetical protein